MSATCPQRVFAGGFRRRRDAAHAADINGGVAARGDTPKASRSQRGSRHLVSRQECSSRFHICGGAPSGSGYTRKQWGVDLAELDAQVTARIPTRTNRDDRYFTDRYQVMPLHGYTRLFQRMLDHPNIKVMLNTSFREIADLFPFRELIWTGPIDEYFDNRFGPLPYRSLEFRFETHDVETFQPVGTINYPNDYDYTRITEFKHLTGQRHPRTTIVYEYPRADGDPYHPVPRPENAERYKAYEALAEQTPHVHFAGRLGTYRYYNMDQVVAQALTVWRRIRSGRLLTVA